MTKGSAIESQSFTFVTFPQTRAVLKVSSTTDIRRYLVFVFKYITKLGNTIYLSTSKDFQGYYVQNTMNICGPLKHHCRNETIFLWKKLVEAGM